ncbi:MAG: hypothetical protein ABS888_00045 [Eubacteriales bacterium]
MSTLTFTPEAQQDTTRYELVQVYRPTGQRIPLATVTGLIAAETERPYWLAQVPDSDYTVAILDA